MNSTIWKFIITGVLVDIHMPSGAKILTAQLQGDDMVLWASVNPAAPSEKRTFHVLPTGGGPRNDDNYSYIATIQMANGALVWHIFEVVVKKQEAEPTTGKQLAITYVDAKLIRNALEEFASVMREHKITWKESMLFGYQESLKILMRQTTG